MKHVALGLVVVTGLVLAVAATVPRSAPAQFKGIPAGGDSRFVVLTSPLAEGGQQMLVVDSSERVVCVYHIKDKSGEIVLKSVRNIYWDLRMSQFNGVSPLPEEIRSLVEER